ncbi:MAG: HD domain-containing protein [Pirellulales bacterium]|nr:HD domain-containing protein [Pirellulales bacterium]
MTGAGATATIARNRREPATDEFVPIALASLFTARQLTFDLYLFEEAVRRPVLFRARQVELTREDVASLEARGVRSLFIRATALDQFQSLLSASLDDALADEDVPTLDRLAILQDTAAPLLSQALQRVSTQEIVDTATQLSQRLARLLGNAKVMPARVFNLLRHDYYTYTHMVNVATYATLLAVELGIRDAAELEQITTGAMLHDIGKRRVAAHVLRKTTPLTPAEEHSIRKHTIMGFEELRGVLSDWGALMMVYQHHERLDGSGYPVGIDAGEIHTYAKICMIADVFDAMTCTRAYRPRLSKSTAAAHLLQNAGSLFDPDYVRCWLHIVRQAT